MQRIDAIRVLLNELEGEIRVLQENDRAKKSVLNQNIVTIRRLLLSVRDEYNRPTVYYWEGDNDD